MAGEKMFDLEKGIADWRRQMRTDGIKTPAPLEELERHLRNEIERQVKSGVSAQQAFGEATQPIGPPNGRRSELQKANELTVEQKRPIAIAAGVLIVVVGFVLVRTVVVQSRDMGRTTDELVVLFVLGSILVLCGAAVGFLASKRSFLVSKRRA